MIQKPEYHTLPCDFFQLIAPTSVPHPQWALFNDNLCEQLGLEKHSIHSLLEVFAGNQPFKGITPLAQAYAGHQFGHFTMLGDGRAHLIGEIKDKNNQLWEIHLKGSGTTKFSRGGDGRASLAPMLREYLISEALHALGIPTTRSLGVINTGDEVYREDVQQGAINVRLASSHLRVGTFEYGATLNDVNKLKALTDFALARHTPHLVGTSNAYLEFFKATLQKQAQLVAQWMGVGFIHGVMNTDNMTISGETIDFGPCAFMDIYDPNTVFSSIDRKGRYAFGNQPSMAHWNLTRLVETLLPMIDGNPDRAQSLAKEQLDSFSEIFHNLYFDILSQKLGFNSYQKPYKNLFEALFQWMYKNKKDMTETFTHLSWSSETQLTQNENKEFYDFVQLWLSQLKRASIDFESAQRTMRTKNPVVVPRNHLVEQALSKALLSDFKPFSELLRAVTSPYENQNKNQIFQRHLEGHSNSYKTFCGT